MSDETMREFLDRLSAEREAFEARWTALHDKTVEFLVPFIRHIIDRRKSRRPGHPGGGRAARRRGEARKRREAYLRAWLVREGLPLPLDEATP